MHNYGERANMKIIFICGSIEPGKDGVGDYVRSLSVELIRQGHEVQAIALNDRNTDEAYEGEQVLDGTAVRVSRLPSVWPDKKRYISAKSHILNFKPDWISFQFVPYSFQDRGLPYNLKSFARMVRGEARWHIMFHELWLGFTPDSPLKDKVIGFFQSRIMLSLTRLIKPALVTTSNSLYGNLLEVNHIPTSILPLFSNIPVARADEAFKEGLMAQMDIDKADRGQWRIIGVFGNIYPDSYLDNAIAEQLEIVAPLKVRIFILGFGNLNESGKDEFSRLQDLFGDRVKFLHLGIQTGNNISNIMQILDYGISCTPAEHIGKSGVFATMRLHGVPVILPKDGSNREMDEATSKYIDYHMNRPSNTWNVSYVAAQYIQMLNSKIPTL